VLTTRSKVAAGQGSCSAVPTAKTQPAVGRPAPGGLDHGRRRVDPGQSLGLRGAGGKLAEQIAGPAPDVEYPPGCWHAGQGQIRRAVGDAVMQLAEPALVIMLRSLAERRNVTITGHT
jgi:hypothetical protein